MKAITSIAAAALILGTLPAAAGSETDKETRHGKGHAALLEELDLSEEQKTQVEAILETQKEKGKELFSEHRETRETRREAGEQMKELREETEGKLKEVLTDEQFARLQELREERRGRGKRGGGHGGEHKGMGKHGKGRHHFSLGSERLRPRAAPG